MRQRHKDHMSLPVLKFMGAALIAGMSGACSSDTLRFSDSPFGNPFTGRADTATTGSVSAPLQKVKASALGMPRPASVSQPFPNAMASSNPVTSVSDVAAAGNSPVLGSVAGWSSAGGTPVRIGAGDSIEALSGRYGVPTTALRQINGLSGGAQPSAGQQLIIPAYNPGTSARKATTAVVAQPVRSAAPRYEPVEKTVAPVRAAAAKPPRYLPIEQDDTTAKVMPRMAKSAPKAAPKANVVDEDDDAPTASVKQPVRTVKIAPKVAAKAAVEDDEDDVPAAAPKRQLNGGFQQVDKTRAAPVRPVAAAQPKATAKIAAKAAPKVADDDDEDEPKAPAKATTKASAKVAAAPKAEPVKTAKVEAPKAAAKADPEATGSVNQTQEFRWPARGRVISGYGSKGPSGANDGINISLPEGTPVKAAEGGTVAYAGEEIKGYGKMVLIRHPNGYVSAYAHNGDMNVKRGDAVKRGQVIAKSGQTGNVTSPQLHFELRKGSETVDPSKFLEGN